MFKTIDRYVLYYYSISSNYMTCIISLSLPIHRGSTFTCHHFKKYILHLCTELDPSIETFAV